MTRLLLGALVLSGCAPELEQIHPASTLPYDVRITGDLPADFDLDATLATLDPGQLVVVGSTDEPELAVIRRLDPHRVGTFDLLAARCPDCLGTCSSGLSRTLEFDLQWTGSDTTEHVVVTLDSVNFTPDGPTFFVPNLVDITTIQVPGSLSVCGSFSYYFDVELSGAGTTGEPARTVFLSRTNLTGSQVGSLSNADSICQAEAVAASLPGTFKAWLGDSTTRPWERMTTVAPPWTRPDGTFVAANVTTLQQLYPQADILLAADGGIVPPNFFGYRLVRTGFEADRTCGDWSTDSGEGYAGLANTIGQFGGPGPGWQHVNFGGDNVPCSWPAALYCFEQ